MASCVKTESKKTQTPTGDSDSDPENKTQGDAEVNGNEATDLESKDPEDKHSESTGKEEASGKSGDSGESSDSWYYNVYDMEEASSILANLASTSGEYHTPPGWKRVYKKRPNENAKDEPTCAKKLKM